MSEGHNYVGIDPGSFEDSVVFYTDNNSEVTRIQAQGRVLRSPEDRRPVQIVEISTPTATDDLIRERLEEKKAA